MKDGRRHPHEVTANAYAGTYVGLPELGREASRGLAAVICGFGNTSSRRPSP